MTQTVENDQQLKQATLWAAKFTAQMLEMEHHRGEMNELAWKLNYDSVREQRDELQLEIDRYIARINLSEGAELTGVHGNAFEVVSQKPVELFSRNWVLHLPGQHPVFSYYLVAVVSLKEYPGAAAPIKQYEMAEYEILMAALESKPDIKEYESFRILQPVNYISQFHDVDDDGAYQVGIRMVQHLIDGNLMAEPQGVNGAREIWRIYVSNAIRDIKNQHDN